MEFIIGFIFCIISFIYIYKEINSYSYNTSHIKCPKCGNFVDIKDMDYEYCKKCAGPSHKLFD